MALLRADQLRTELLESNRRYRSDLKWQESAGGVTLYEPDEAHLAHGNFLPTTYRAILRDPEWRRRFEKIHSHCKKLPPRTCGGHWKELDSCMSSDALLMNLFCHPDSLVDGRVYRLLGAPAGARPVFGFKARVPLTNGRADQTEVDMLLGDLLVESKLTESDFQRKAKVIVEGYRDFAQVFDRRLLPQQGEHYLGYQLIRNVLAAYALDKSFCLMFHALRDDLREEWYSVMSAVRFPELKTRCKTLTWQELAAHLPPRLRRFLAEKYGIEAASAARA